MSGLLPQDIKLTAAALETISEGYRGLIGILDPVASIEFAYPVGDVAGGSWSLSYFSKRDVPASTVFKVGEIELALSADAQRKLRGKIIDVAAGKIRVRRQRSGED